MGILSQCQLAIEEVADFDTLAWCESSVVKRLHMDNSMSLVLHNWERKVCCHCHQTVRLN